MMQSNTEIVLFDSVSPRICREGVCPGLSPTQLSPGKCHKVPVSLSASTQPQVTFATLGRVLVLYLTTQSPLSPWIKSAVLQVRCLHVSCALMCRKLPKEINVNTRDVSGKRHPGAQCLPRAAGALPGDNCPFPDCPPLPGDTVDPSCVMGKLWLLLQRSLHCLSAECGITAWSGSAAPARCGTNQQLLRGRPDAVSFPVAFLYGKTPPGKLLGSEIFRHSMLFLVAQFPVLGWDGLEATLVSSSRSPHGIVLRSVQFCASPFESWLYSKDCSVR